MELKTHYVVEVVIDKKWTPLVNIKERTVRYTKYARAISEAEYQARFRKAVRLVRVQTVTTTTHKVCKTIKPRTQK